MQIKNGEKNIYILLNLSGKKCYEFKKKLHLSLRLALLSKTETSLAQNFSIW